MVHDARKAITPGSSLRHCLFLTKHIQGSAYINHDGTMPHIHFGILGVEREQHVHPSRGRYANGEIEAGQSRVLLPVPLPAVFLPPAVASPAEPRSDHLL